jgi:hypothetical protein
MPIIGVEDTAVKPSRLAYPKPGRGDANGLFW